MPLFTPTHDHDATPPSSLDWASVQWAQPWFNSVSDVADHALEIDESSVCARLNRLILSGDLMQRPRTGQGEKLSFFPADRVPTQEPGYFYEQYIAQTGRVPTRNNWHDAFNGLMWLSMPHTKAQLNAIQAQQIKRALDAGQTPGQRGPVRDACTLIDENSIILACAQDEIWQRLRGFDWHALFVQHRTDFLLSTEAWVFGHALLEQLMNPFKSLTAHVFVVPVERKYFHWPKAERLQFIDEAAAAWLQSMHATGGLSPSAMSPLPVLGIPGWWADNTRPDFYADTNVFRAGRTRQKST